MTDEAANDETRCPKCHKLLMKENIIKCTRCKEMVPVDNPVYKEKTVKILVDELYQLKMRMGLVN